LRQPLTLVHSRTAMRSDSGGVRRRMAVSRVTGGRRQAGWQGCRRIGWAGRNSGGNARPAARLLLFGLVLLFTEFGLPFLQADVDAISDCGEQPGMESEGWGDDPADGRVSGCSIPDKRGNVFRPVSTWREEPGEDDDSVGSEFNAAVEGLLDGGLGEFHMGGFNDFVAALLPKAAGCVVEQCIAFGAA